MNFYKLSVHVEGSSKTHFVRLPEFFGRVLRVGKVVVVLGIALLVLQVGVLSSYDFLKNRTIGSRTSLIKKLNKEFKSLK